MSATHIEPIIPCDTTPPLLSFFSRLQWVLLALIIFGGTFVRWVELGERPYHHDESLHGMYGRYFYDFPDQNFYRYDPMLHGPLLYNLLRVVYSTAGDSDAGARSLVALLGTIALCAPLLFRRYLTPLAVLAVTAFIAFSPTLVYWSRFLREDPLVISAMLMMLYGIACAPTARKPFWFFVGLALHFCAKENSYVTVALLTGYLAYEAIVQQLLKGSDSFLRRCIAYLRAHPWHLLFGLAAGVFVFCYFYSAGFRYSPGILDGLYRKSIGYWLEHHGKERISGPFLFHVFLLSWYELPFVLLALAQAVLLYRSAPRALQWAIGALLTFALAMYLAFRGQNIEQISLFASLKLKSALDLFGCIVLAGHAVLVTTAHLMRQERTLAFFGYLFTASLFTYSYLGEKVPWLSIYPLSAGVVYLTLYYQQYLLEGEAASYRVAFGKIVSSGGVVLTLLGAAFVLQEGWAENGHFIAAGISLVAVGAILEQLQWSAPVRVLPIVIGAVLLFNLRAMVQTNFVYAGHAREFISQVHTTPEFHALMHHIRDEMTVAQRGFRPTLLTTGEATWPVTWYMRDMSGYRFQAAPNERENFSYIIEDWRESQSTVREGFRVERINLRGWWVPDYSAMTLRRFLNYALNHTPWSGVGYQYVNLLVKER